MMIRMTVDPTGYFPKDKYARLLMAVGILPTWITEPEEPAMDQFRRHYMFPCHEDDNAQIDAIGKMYYPEDPPQIPYLHVETEIEDIYFYPNAMVGIKNKKTGNTILTRLD
jgi:hypothetical protein